MKNDVWEYNTLRISADFSKEYLDKLGKNRWELVTAITIPSGTAMISSADYLIFKRKVK